MKTKILLFFLTLFSYVSSFAQAGAALDFNGLSDNAAITSNASFNVNKFSIETWLYVDLADSSSVQFIASKGSENMEIHLSPSGGIRFLPAAGVYLDAEINTITYNTWMHLAVVYDPSIGLGKMYVNGAEVSLTNFGAYPTTTPIVNNSTDFLIGIRNGGAYPFRGKLDEYRIWNRVLTQAEIQARMNCEIPTTSCGLIANLHFNQGIGGGDNSAITSLTDSSGFNNNAAMFSFTKTGTSSNFVATGGVVSGTNCTFEVLTAAATQVFIAGGTVANLIASGSNLKWYDVATLGIPLNSNTVLTNNTYYVSQTINGCESDRIAVNVFVTIPSPTALTPQTFCNNGSVSNLTATGSNIQWYANVSGGTVLASTTTLVNGTTYYVSQTINGFESSSRTAVIVNLNTTPTIAPTASQNQTFCARSLVSDIATTNGTAIKWYANPTGGIALSNTTLLENATIYYGSQTVNACESSSRVAVTISIITTATPTVIPTQSFCGTATIANLAATGNSLNWYSTESGGEPLMTSSALITDTIYYVSQIINGCESLRSSVAVTITPNDAPFANDNQIICESGTIANLTAFGSNIQWYANLTGGTVLAAAVSLTNNTTYFASQTVNGCESASRTAVIAIINSLPSAPVASSTQTFCGSGNIIQLTATGTDILWYDNPSGGTRLLPIDSLINNTTYYASQIVNGCESASRTAVVVTINAKPSAPVASSTQIFCGNAMIQNLTATGTNIKWYATEVGGTPIPASATIIISEIYYVSQTVNGCESVRIPITVQVINTIPPTFEAQQLFCSAATIANFTPVPNNAMDFSNLKWYSAAVGGVVLASTATLVHNTTYYAVMSINGCESVRVPVTAKINTGGIQFVNGAVATSGDGLSWATAFKTVQEAINESCSNEIWVAAGTYVPTQYPTTCLGCTTNRDFTFFLTSNVQLYGGFNGSETSRNQRNIGQNQTILSGNIGDPMTIADNVYNVIISENNTSTAILDGFVITGANGNLPNQPRNIKFFQIPRAAGGGINLIGSQLNIRNCFFTNNYSEVGAAMALVTSNPVVSNSVFANNNAIVAGAIFNQDASPRFENCTFNGNTATAIGQTMYNQTNSNPTIVNCIIWNTIIGNPIETRNESGNGQFNTITAVNCILRDLGPTYAGSGNINSNPMFLNQADALGQDLKAMTSDDGLALRFDSPALNAGSNVNTPLLDIRSNPIYNTTKDIGAYERQIPNSCTTETTWNGTAWSDGSPNGTTAAFFTGNYTATADLTACYVGVKGNAVVNIPSGFDLTVSNEIIVASSATLTFENNANLLQTSTATNTGNVNVKRTTPIQRLAYTMWSSPVANQNALAFSPLTVPTRFYTYAEADNTFVELATPSITNFAVAKGYAIRAPNTFPASSTAEFVGTYNGTPNNGDYTFAGSKVANGYNLIGNPYPSTILVDTFLTTNQNVNTLYFWDNSNLGTAGNRYATRNSFTGTFSAVSARTPTNFIAPGQGFYVQITSATNTNVVFNNTMRSSENSNAVFFRNATSDKSLFKLNLLSPTNNFNQIAIGYMNGATNGIDNQIDAIPFAQSPTMVSSLINNVDYVIQGRSLPFANTDVVPLGFKTDVAGNYSFTTEAFEGVFANNQNVFVKDNLVGMTHNVKQSPYQFSTNAGAFNSRFEIVYQSTLGIENPNFNDNSVFVFQKDGAIHVNSEAIKMKNVAIFDLRGRKITENTNINATTTEFNLNVEQQVLLVKITSLDGQVVTKKIVY